MNAAARAIAGDVGTTVAIPAPLAADSTRRKALAFAIMCLGCFMAYLDTQIVSASIQEIGGGLSATSDELSWIQSSYLVAEIIVIPLTAWLSRVMSTRRLLAASAANFTLASVLCGSASDMRTMIVFRALQGFFGGSIFTRRRRLVSRQAKTYRGVLRQCCRRSRADAWSGRRRLDYRWLVMALVVLRQHRARHAGHAVGSHPGQSRRA